MTQEGAKIQPAIVRILPGSFAQQGDHAHGCHTAPAKGSGVLTTPTPIALSRVFSLPALTGRPLGTLPVAAQTP